MSNSLSVDPLFVGLTRPPMIFGVSIKYALLNMMISLIIFIFTTSIYIIMIAAIVHIIGYIICFQEPRFIELYAIYMDKSTKCTNKYYHGANSYKV